MRTLQLKSGYLVITVTYFKVWMKYYHKRAEKIQNIAHYKLKENEEHFNVLITFCMNYETFELKKREQCVKSVY